MESFVIKNFFFKYVFICYMNKKSPGTYRDKTFREISRHWEAKG